MTFDEIVLHNFGLYKGRHQIGLTPKGPNKPVVLIGGLNGGGKTTFLDALHLGLYGKRARTSNRGSLGYEDYLRRCINRGVAVSEGAAIEIQFRHRSEGEDHTYRVHRSWFVSNHGTLAERVEVLKDGKSDQVLTESWSDMVEELIPAGMSHLFFFDGEKIEGFADLENSAQLLSKAVHSLLGLDLVDRLSADLDTLGGRQRAGLKISPDGEQFNLLEEELRKLEAIRKELVSTRASKQNVKDGLEIRVRDLESLYLAEGGSLYESRDELKEARERADQRLKQVEDEIRHLTAGAAPLLLVSSLLSDVEKQSRREDAAEQAARLTDILYERDQELIRELKKKKASPNLTTHIKKFTEANRMRHAAHTQVDMYLRLGSETRENLALLLSTPLLRSTYDECLRLVGLSEQTRAELAELDRKLDGVPDGGRISPIVKDLAEARKDLAEVNVELTDLDFEIDRLRREMDSKKARWRVLLEKQLELEFENDDVRRIIRHSKKVQETLVKFRKAVAAKHVARIEQLILESFKHLLRKESLVAGLKIDPERFTLELTGVDGELILPDRLSAGERQLLAVSMLWGLARAAGRPLPAVVDTPLGRLDSTHRRKLVERYFPYASHQVLLLSTDEEIDEEHYRSLKPWLAHTYTLEYDETSRATTVKPGYFW